MNSKRAAYRVTFDTPLTRLLRHKWVTYVLKCGDIELYLFIDKDYPLENVRKALAEVETKGSATCRKSRFTSCFIEKL